MSINAEQPECQEWIFNDAHQQQQDSDRAGTSPIQCSTNNNPTTATTQHHQHEQSPNTRRLVNFAPVCDVELLETVQHVRIMPSSPMQRPDDPITPDASSYNSDRPFGLFTSNNSTQPLALQLEHSGSSANSQGSSVLAGMGAAQTPADFKSISSHLIPIDDIEEVLVDELFFSSSHIGVVGREGGGAVSSSHDTTEDPLTSHDGIVVPSSHQHSSSNSPTAASLTSPPSCVDVASGAGSAASVPLGRGITGSVMPMIWTDEEQHVSRRPVAVKILHRGHPGAVSALGKDLTVKLAMERCSPTTTEDNAQTQQLLGRDNVMPLLAAYICGDDIYCVMERFSGSFFLTPQNQLQRIPENILVLAAREMFQGLRYLHDTLSILHRDIKPSNVLYHVDGRVRIIDFGHSTVASTVTTSTGGVIEDSSQNFLGSLTFMAKERLLGEPYSFNSDVWSMGISLMAMFLGDHPFRLILGDEYDDGPHEQKYWSIMEMLNDDNAPTWFPNVVEPLLRSHGASPLFIDFLRSSCTIDAKERPQARDLLNHAWITQQQGRQSTPDVSALSEYFRQL